MPVVGANLALFDRAAPLVRLDGLDDFHHLRRSEIRQACAQSRDEIRYREEPFRIQRHAEARRIVAQHERHELRQLNERLLWPRHGALHASACSSSTFFSAAARFDNPLARWKRW